MKKKKRIKQIEKDSFIKLGLIHEPERENWVGIRPTVFKDGKTYNRQKEKNELRKEISNDSIS